MSLGSYSCLICAPGLEDHIMYVKSLSSRGNSAKLLVVNNGAEPQKLKEGMLLLGITKWQKHIIGESRVVFNSTFFLVWILGAL